MAEKIERPIQLSPVDTLDRKSAVALLIQDGVDRASLDELPWNRIAEWVGDLPLALELLQQSLTINPRGARRDARD
jgi:hypothetical protein